MDERTEAPTVPVYTATALQVRVKCVNRCPDRASARARMMQTLAHVAEKVRGVKRWMGPNCRLVVLPEYFLTSFPQDEPIAAWADKAALAPDGPEYEAMGRIAQDNDVYLAGNAYELDRHFPGLYFQTCFVVAPDGTVILRYRRLNSMFAPTPHDVWDKYLDIYGLDAVFPVADTPIGRLAPIASEEILYPEIARCFAMRGAEVFLHSSSENGSIEPTPKDIAKRARAIENMAYVVSANTGGLDDIDLTEDSANGCSRVIDYQGNVMRIAGWGETANASAQLDINVLRRERRKPGMSNYLSRQRNEVFVHAYAAHVHQPANGLLDANGEVRSVPRSHFAEAQRRTIQSLIDKGVI
ncbi:MAG: nitrilase-related carbon-nitrogen hydrolase [Rhodospirillaceae bacterium]|nr:nitrilase-related carbon-nitrogen hydrolase [Rhodospirillaceae bacterium]